MTNRRNTKSALMLSILSLLLCFSMMIGTTFAWFTDSVSSTNNIIKSGNLDVTLEYWNGTEWKDVNGSSEIFDNAALWEPGYTQVAYLRLANAGSLALKYQLGINIISETAGVNKAGQDFKLSDYIYFDVAESAAFSEFASRDDAMVLATETAKISQGYYKAGSLLAGDAPIYLTMVVYMPESVGNDANHNGVAKPEINLGINVLATQLMAEDDSFGNDYDENATYVPAWDGTVGEVPAAVDGVITINTAEELAAFAASVNGTTYSLRSTAETYKDVTVKLGADINLGNKSWTPIGANGDTAGFQGTFDGQGHTIYNLKVDNTTRAYQSAGLFGSARYATIKNFKVVNAKITNLDDAGNTSNGAAVIVGAAQFATTISNVHVENASVTSNRRVSAIAGYYVGTITGCTVKNTTLTATFDQLADGTYDNCDKVGGIIAYSNGASTITNNSVENITIKGYRDLGGIAGYATTSTLTNNKVSGLTMIVDNSHDYKGYGDASAKYDANDIIGEGTADASNTASGSSSVNIKEIADGFFTDDAGTYYIYSAAGLKAFADSVNKYSNYERPYEGETVKLMNDVDLGGAEWIPIGDYRFSANRFCGTFDGQGYTVSNFKITKKTDKNDSNKSSYGFFGNMEGTVKNLTIDNASIKSYAYVGALIGRMTNGNVENCHVKNSSVETTYWQAGGVFGQINDNCRVVNCSITNSTVTGAAAIGGISGPVTAANADTAKELLFENCSVNNCKLVQSGTFGASYDKMFAAGFAYIEADDNLTNINNFKAVKTTVKGVNSTVISQVVEGSRVYVDGKIPVATADALTSTLANATSDVSVVFLADITGNAVATQVKDVNAVIDGNGYKFNGVLQLNSGSRDSAEALTIKNVNFVTDTAIDSFIDNMSVTNYRYAHNVTVEGCSFTATGAAKYTTVGAKFNSPYDIVIKDCTASGLHSIIQSKGGHKTFVVDGVTATDCKNGISFGTHPNATVKNCKITTVGNYNYGVRGDGNTAGAYALNVENSVITSNVPVQIRKMTAGTNYTVSFTGTNTLTENASGYQVIITAGEYADDNTVTPCAGTITLNGADGLTVYTGK